MVTQNIKLYIVNETINIQATTEKKESELKAIMYLLQNKLEEMAEEIYRSYELYKVGKRTPFVESLEETLNQPSKSIIELSLDIDKVLHSMINKAVIEFFSTKKELIEQLHRTTNTANPLTYAIILKEDSFENRASIFDFFDKYDLTDTARKFPVIFHILPKGMEDAIIQSKIVTLN